MMRRCRNPNNPDYQKYYGARGIEVCERWLKFENFYEDMGPRPEGMTLNRINNDGNYEPSNCEWTSDRVQSTNKRSRVDNPPRFRGAYKHGNRYMAVIDGIYLGNFATEEEAARAYDWKARQLFGDTFSYFNFNDDKSYPPTWSPPPLRNLRGSRVPSIVGKKFEKLTVVSDDCTFENGVRKIEVCCACDPGKVYRVSRQSVTDGRATQCRRCGLKATWLKRSRSA